MCFEILASCSLTIRVVGMDCSSLTLQKMRKESVLTQGSTGHSIFPMCVHIDILIYPCMYINMYDSMLIAISCIFATRNQEIFRWNTSQWKSRKTCRFFFLLCWTWIVYLQNCQDPSVTCTVTKQTSRNPLIPAASMHMLLEQNYWIKCEPFQSLLEHHGAHRIFKML